MMISIDTECTGVNITHGALPFYTTIARDDENDPVHQWEWWVDPITREVEVLANDLSCIQDELDEAELVVAQNGKFDCAMLEQLGIVWPWEKMVDTLISGHLINSGDKHDLTSMVKEYLAGEDIQPYEDALEDAVKDCRRIIQQARLRRKRGKDSDDIALWRIAEEDLEEMPSAGSNCWRADYWLPRAVAQYLSYPTTHPYWTILSEYSNMDSLSTLFLWKAHEKIIKDRKLWKIFVERNKLPRIAHIVQYRRGMSMNKKVVDTNIAQYGREAKELGDKCEDIARDLGHDFTLPKGGRSNALMNFVFSEDGLGMKPFKYTEKGNPSFDADTLKHYIDTLDPYHPGHNFFKWFAEKKLRDKAISDLEGYKRFWIRSKGDWYRIHSSLNPTGSRSLRWSSNSPNSQNVGKGEDGEFTIRECFGPEPDREWWFLDMKNIERRIPAYEANEEEIIALLERPNDPPYYGNEYCLVAHLLHPELFEGCVNDKGELDGRIFKKRYKETWYQWTKNFVLATQYQAQKRRADATAHCPGAWDMIKGRFWRQEALNKKCLDHASKYGYVETIPDKRVDPERGYPIMVGRSIDGYVTPTTPLNYHTSGTAMWLMATAMVRCQDQIEQWDADIYMIAQIHDELIFDMPRSLIHPSEDAKIENGESSRSNLWRAKRLQHLMEIGGDNIGLPTPVGIEYSTESWSNDDVISF